jgi:hypothetical protein
VMSAPAASMPAPVPLADGVPSGNSDR